MRYPQPAARLGRLFSSLRASLYASLSFLSSFFLPYLTLCMSFVMKCSTSAFTFPISSLTPDALSHACTQQNSIHICMTHTTPHSSSAPVPSLLFFFTS
ncbi:hypothetical protein BCR43DRAFT_485702, partial [Syncephalastrum racemosum]